MTERQNEERRPLHYLLPNLRNDWLVEVGGKEGIAICPNAIGKSFSRHAHCCGVSMIEAPALTQL